MSVQLIVYPQSFNGVFNAISGSSTELIVNGINFAGIDNTSTYTTNSATPYLDVITNKFPSVVNTWYRYRSSIVGTPAFPVSNGANVVLDSLGNGSTEPTGIYQRIGPLTIGATYNITLTVATGGNAANGSFLFKIFDTVNPQGSVTTFSTATATTITKTFTATFSNMTIMCNYYSTVAEDFTISNISVQPISGATSGTPIVESGEVLLDLYEDEDLPLTLSVDDFKNVAEKVQSYSKAFNIPETKRNKRIFNQIFEVTRENDGVIFNPYKRTQCVLKQDGFTLFKGFMRLLDVTDKDGEVSYNINLYSEVIALADYLKDLSFRDLDFTELTHDYNKTQIKYSWDDVGAGITYDNPSTSGFRDANSTVKYPFVNWNNQWLIATTGGTPTAGNPQLVNLEQAFRPFINIKYIIDRIFQNSPFTFTSDFFNTTDFGKLYMDFNWGADNSPTTSNTIVNGFYDVSTATNFAPNGSFGNLHLTSNFSAVDYDSITNKITAPTDNVQYNIAYQYQIKRVISGSEQSARWLLTRAATGLTEVIDLFPMQPSTNQDYTGILTPILQLNDTLEAQFSTNTTGGIVQDFSASAVTAIVTIQKSILSVTTDVILQTLRGELGQWDFLKGLITMFNLVTLVDENNPNNIIIEPYSDVFINNTAKPLQWTDKIDVSEMKLEPLTDLTKKTIFKFVEDEDDFAFTNYKNQVGGHLYGSKKYDAGSEFNILDDEDEIIAEPFAATVVKPLASQFSSFITPALYSYNSEDDTSEGFDNSPRIMYNNGIKSAGASYYIPAQNGLASENQTNFLQFSHLSDIPTIASSRDFHFGECQLLTGVGNATANNLFNTYWLPYYSELYNPNTRTMTIKVNLSPADINTFKFNDTVMIKNRVFRVNKIDYKPNDLATVEFILIP